MFNILDWGNIYNVNAIYNRWNRQKTCQQTVTYIYSVTWSEQSYNITCIDERFKQDEHRFVRLSPHRGG